eukprot:1552406-Pleurochrysis_carterae.AAC.2
MNTKPTYSEKDNRGLMRKAFRAGEKRYGTNMKHRRGGKKMGKGERRERGRMELNIGENPNNGCLRTPEAYILVRGAFTLPYLTHPRARASPSSGRGNRACNTRRVDARAHPSTTPAQPS